MPYVLEMPVEKTGKPVAETPDRNMLFAMNRVFVYAAAQYTAPSVDFFISLYGNAFFDQIFGMVEYKYAPGLVSRCFSVITVVSDDMPAKFYTCSELFFEHCNDHQTRNYGDHRRRKLGLFQKGGAARVRKS